jgi:hypothetical protein
LATSVMFAVRKLELRIALPALTLVMAFSFATA